MKMVLVFLMLLQCHQESAQLNIISVLINIIFKDNLEKTVENFRILLFSVRSKETIVKL